MAEAERRLTARLLELTDELAALVMRSQEIQREMREIIAKMPIDDAPTASPRRRKRSRPKLRGKSAKPR